MNSTMGLSRVNITKGKVAQTSLKLIALLNISVFGFSIFTPYMESTPPLLCSMTKAKRTQLLASFSFNYSNYNISSSTSKLPSMNIGLVKCATAD